ncbi:DUF4365 domain-containing protein [Blastococcus sp. KM273129]|uniref:DUF4365 domain-containing protein n=1 Tax=Blastococcus sp. KM273129 TaxID=2570315 RepID=UPI001F23021F|nr:DUF4365 domain-containing protein [Blastococcus sp. KM273129]
MAKRIDVSTHRGDAGVALIHLRTNQMGFVWHDRAVDAGIDGTIEIRDPGTGAMSNRHLLVQSKASARPFAGENDRSFHYTCEQRDIDYWMQAEAPVLLICSHPESEQAWWMHVQAWFTDPVRRASGRIDFDKATQRFDATAAPRLLSLADPHAQARLVTAEQRPEVLLSNLLPVTMPPTIYSSPTAAASAGEVYQVMRAEPAAATRLDWTLHGGRLFTFADPTGTALSRAVTGAPETVGVGEWETDPVGERNLVRLLNRALIHDVAGDCTYHAGRDLIFFSATPDLTHRKIVGGTGQPRLVFHAKHNKRTGKISYYKHAALRWQFLHLDDAWLCALTPEAHYTRDGYRDSRFIADLLAGLKRLDRNPAVRGHVRMWATYLRGERPLLDQDATRLLDFGPPLTFTSQVGIDDADWLTDHRTTASPPTTAGIPGDAPATEDALSLFDEV